MAESVAQAMDEVSTKLEELSAATARLSALIISEPPPEFRFDVTAVTASTARVEWDTAPAGVTQWRVGREGVDSGGAGPWSTIVPASSTVQNFGNLLPGTEYTFFLEGGPIARTVKATTQKVVVPPTGATAAELLGWGTPHGVSDEFDYEGRPDPTKWRYCGEYGVGWPGHNRNGRRMPENSFVKDGILTLRGDANGNTGWLRQNHQTRFGRWEIRSRSRNTGPSGSTYHPLHLIWPYNEQWPENGELDWLEYTNPDATEAGAWLHYPHPEDVDIQQAGPFHKACDMTQWHNFAFEWDATGVRSWIDAIPWYEVKGGAGPAGRKNIQDMTSGRLTIQLDAFAKSGLRPAVFEVAWSRFYSL
jgi:hypothetical protein